MSSPHSAGSGRHRGSARPTTALSWLWRRPSHRSAVKCLGLAASALGVATAFAAPAPGASYELTAAEVQQPAAIARAETVSAPARVASYGIIGFTAKAAPKAKAKARATDSAKSTRTATGISRNTSRAGLSNVGGMTPNAIAVINAVKAEFPGSGPFGGYRPGDPLDHGTGHAVDIMCSTAEGNEIAAFVQANATTLNVKYVIWRQRIWYPGGSWQAMEDRGSPTANHMDHVHVSVF